MKTTGWRVAGAWLIAVGACGGTVVLGTPMDGGSAPPGSLGADASRGSDASSGDDTVGDDTSRADDTAGDGTAGDDITGDDVGTGDDTAGDDAIAGDDGGSSGDLDASFDAAILDAPLADASGSSIETFEFIMRGAVVQPMSCSFFHWQFHGPNNPTTVPDVFLRNTGDVPLTYIAAPVWNGGGMYQPGVPAAPSPDLTGTLAPGESVDITSVFLGGVVALLGSPKPFSAYPDGSFEAQDEGQIGWPQGVPNSTGASTMYVAQLFSTPSCADEAPEW